jgi:gas vesicle protein
MEMEQMTARLLAEIRTVQEQIKEDIKADQERMAARLEDKPEAIQDKMDATQEEITARMASITSWIEENN